jgi:hypothetical protein
MQVQLWKVRIGMKVLTRVRGSVLAMSLLALCTMGADDAKEGFEVHDMKRPQPAKVEPGNFSTQDQAGTAPSDATVLFDGKDLSQWKSDKGGDAEWKVGDGWFEVAPGKGIIQSKPEFGDCQLHAEWREPEDVKGNSQGRGNSGIFLMGMYELQVLDSAGTETYPDGMAGSMYGQYPPLVNATRPAGQWNVYDVVFRAPRLDDSGKVTAPARVTVFFNGVLVQDNMKLIGPTMHRALTTYPSNLPAKGPIALQDHGNPVRFRNVWVRELKGDRPKPPVRPAGEGH